MSRRYRPKAPAAGSFDQNDGVAGVVYILRNDAFKEHWLKIGQSRHSGHVRARDMNRAASTGIPAHHVCVYECRTLDCGTAEKAVFQELRAYRKGRQEFFEVDIEFAKSVIARVCNEMDAAVRRKLAQQEQAAREAAAQREAAARRANDEFIRAAEERRSQAAEQERRSQAESEWQRHEADWRKLEQIRREREEQDARAALPMVDMTCPACSLVLTIPGSAAGSGSQKLRCKNCSAVFFPDGRLLSSSGDAPTVDSDFTPRYTQESPPKAASRPSMLKSDGVVAACVLAFAALIVASSWESKPQKATASTAKPSVAVAPPVPTPKTQQQLMDEAANEMAARYPYLNTKAGAKVIDLIIQRRDALIATGVSPASALRLAAMEIAPQHQPRP